MEHIELIELLIIVLSIYMIPAAIGSQTKYRSGILILNLFLGWTFLGWIAALIWAVSAPIDKEKEVESTKYVPVDKQCNLDDVKEEDIQIALYYKGVSDEDLRKLLKNNKSNTRYLVYREFLIRYPNGMKDEDNRYPGGRKY